MAIRTPLPVGKCSHQHNHALTRSWGAQSLQLIRGTSLHARCGCAITTSQGVSSGSVGAGPWPGSRRSQNSCRTPKSSDIWGSMKVPTSDRKSIRHQNKYRSRRHEQRNSWTRKRAVGASSKIIIIVEGDWKTFRRYQPKWDARLYHYMYRYFDNKGSV